MTQQCGVTEQVFTYSVIALAEQYSCRGWTAEWGDNSPAFFSPSTSHCFHLALWYIVVNLFYFILFLFNFNSFDASTPGEADLLTLLHKIGRRRGLMTLGLLARQICIEHVTLTWLVYVLTVQLGFYGYFPTCVCVNALDLGMISRPIVRHCINTKF